MTMTEEIMIGIIFEIKKFRNELPRIYSLAEKEYMEANEDVAVNPHGHIIVSELSSYHAVRFYKLLHLYVDEELYTYDQE